MTLVQRRPSRTALAVLLAALALGPGASAQAETAAAPAPCGGTDLLAKARAEQPEAYAAFEHEAGTVPNAEGLLWRIQSGDAPPSYLFGTMHTTEADLVALSAPVREALGQARAVVVELADATGVATKAAMVAYISKNALDLSAKGLDGYDPAEVAEIKRRLAEVGFPATAANALKPWFLSVTLQAAGCETKQMMKGAPTVDGQVEAIGREAGARIVGLETAVEQMDTVAKVDDATARRMVREAVASPHAAEDLRATTMALYRARRVGWYFAMRGGKLGAALDVTADAAFLADLVDRRNGLMFDRSKDLISGGGAFMAVGALHLPGENGLVELYRKAGLTVTRVW
jgi:uncharacterized protein YbaP (TraB family)